MDQHFHVKLDFIWDGSDEEVYETKKRLAQISLTFTHRDFSGAQLSPDEKKEFFTELLRKKLQRMAADRFGKTIRLTNDGVKTGSITVIIGLVLLGAKEYKSAREGVLQFVKDLKAASQALYGIARNSYSQIQQRRKQKALQHRTIGQ